jgi:hypothetical protein
MMRRLTVLVLVIALVVVMRKRLARLFTRATGTWVGSEP